MNKKIVITLLILALIAGGFFLFTDQSITGNAVKIDSSEKNVKEFTLKATRFVYEPDTITVNKGDKVKITINNIDTTHGIRIPEYNIKDTEQIEFIANKSGEFDFYCTVYCGEQHKEMKGKLIVK